MVRTSYTPSAFSETSTVCSIEKEHERVKRAFRDVGHPPTYRYDLEHGVETRRTVPVGPMGHNVLNQPSRI
ncbi:hypothetical protein CSHISOI_05389 [Colletotrichum shisoi]|uniref:Uncharacterized protein n=1 Tax=Colletotrichum shisoi TaxID=2078593 RepID=A0A5Q4BSQ5_9PEZI|nr:hypothetical protein CSHISOI_05389 [Colletotrichum shisoi]